MSYLYFLLFCFYFSGLITSVGEERAVDFFSHLLVIMLFPFEGVPLCALDRLRYFIYYSKFDKHPDLIFVSRVP